MQNAIKVFGHWAPSIMDIVKATDPSTVTQHGLYMRPLGETPTVGPPKTAPSGPSTPAQTPPETREQTPPPSPTKASCSSASEPPSTTSSSRASATQHTPGKSLGSLTSSQRADSAKVELASSKAPLPKTASSTESPVDQKACPSSRAHPKVDPTASDQADPSTADPKSDPEHSAMKVSQENSEGSGLEAQRGWGRGRVTLLGDAAHATIPNGEWGCAALRCAVLCCAVLCCAVLCCAVLCCAVLCCAVLCCAVLCCAVLCCAVLCCAVLCCSKVCPATAGQLFT